MQLSCDARLIGWPSICAMDCDAEEYCVVGDARRNSFFSARILRNELIEGPTLFSEPGLRAKLESLEEGMPVFSSEVLPQFDRPVVRFPSALVLARLAEDPGHSFFLPPLEPIYMREPHITLRK
jgi:tRNA A37 threonylcarbamoyladenosine modification protein TsaB